MQVTITAVADCTIGDLYKTMLAGETIVITRSASDLSRMPSLQALVAAGTVTLAAVPTATELASGMLSAPQTIQAQDMSPVAAAAVDAPEIILRIPVPAGAGGAPDDVTVYALDAVPYKARVLWAKMIVSAAVGASTAALRTQAAGAGTLLATLDTAAVGLVPSPNTGFATSVVTPGSSVGLFVRRSDSAIAGEILVSLRRES